MSIQVLYADTLFLSNFVMNLLALSLTGKVMHMPNKKSRLLLSATLGGVYALVAVLLRFPGPLHIGTGLLLSVLLVLIAFGNFLRVWLFLRAFALFYFSSVLLGGGIEALFALLEGAFGMRSDVFLRPADVVLLLGFSAYLILGLLSRFLSGGEMPHSVAVSIRFQNRTVNVPLLVDSGASLRDPITGRGAILVRQEALRTLLPRSLLIASDHAHGVSMPHESTLARRCRLLPMVGAAGERLLLAFRPDEVRLLSDGGELDVWVALYTSPDTRFGGCKGVLPAALLYGREAVKGKCQKTKRRVL